jgi:hypothetical protein
MGQDERTKGRLTRWFDVSLGSFFLRSRLDSCSSSEKEFGYGDQRGDLPNPEKKHPFDDLSLDVGTVLFGHQALGQIFFLFSKSQFETFRNGTGLGGSICAASRIERIFVVLTD